MERNRIRFAVVMYIPFILFFIFVSRLYFLQIWKGEWYLERSQNNFIQQWPVPHQRGLILDQAGITLADNRPSYDVYITWSLVWDEKKVAQSLGALLGLKPNQIRAKEKKIREKIEQHSRRSFLFVSSDSTERCIALEKWTEANTIQGVQIQPFLSKEGCRVSMIPFLLPTKQGVFYALQELIQIPEEEMETSIAGFLKQSQGLAQFKPILFASDISYDAYVRVQAAISIGLLPGVAVFDSIKRRYLHGAFASHALGFINEVSRNDILSYPEWYRAGDRIGRKGIEKVYEPLLRGKDGMELFVVDAKGRRYTDEWRSALLGKERMVVPIAGHSLVLSIDYHMQKAAEEAFKGLAGSVVAMDPNTGFVLALASFPKYDPNQIVGRSNQKILQELTKDPLKPWLNKAIEEHYAPGSTFKAITAIAGYEHNLLTQHAKENCSGTFHLGRSTWRCFKREGHGTIDVVEALKTSCDVFFYKLGQQLGSDRLAETARLFGFGKKSGIDLDREIAGIMPDSAFYKKRLGYHAPGFVVNSAIGQGDVTVTALQLAVAYSAIVNGGTIYKPQLLREVRDAAGKLVQEQKPNPIAHLKETVEDLAFVKAGLSHVMEPGGTAYGLQYRPDLPKLAKWLKEFQISIGGKTGTAQVVKLSKTIKHLRPEEVEYQKRDHAWFVLFAPVLDTELVVVVMTEHGGFGGTTSAPVAAQVAQTWFEEVRGKGRYAHLKHAPHAHVKEVVPRKNAEASHVISR